MNKRINEIFCLSILIFPSLSFAELTAKEIMTKSEDVRKVDDIQADSILVTGAKDGPEKRKEFKWWRKLTSDQIHFNTLTRFSKPAEIRGEGILFLEHGEGKNEILMYLPHYKKIRRVESQQQKSSFMGSELSYSDMASPHVDDYQHKVLKAEKCPAQEELNCWVIESVPSTPSIQERTGYGKVVQWIRQDNFMPFKQESYDEAQVLFKRVTFDQIKVVDPKKNKWMAHQVRVDNLKNSKFTALTFQKVKANSGISDATFTQEQLSKAP